MKTPTFAPVSAENIAESMLVSFNTIAQSFPVMVNMAIVEHVDFPTAWVQPVGEHVTVPVLLTPGEVYAEYAYHDGR